MRLLLTMALLCRLNYEKRIVKTSSLFSLIEALKGAVEADEVHSVILKHVGTQDRTKAMPIDNAERTAVHDIVVYNVAAGAVALCRQALKELLR